jgi:hypothetical protein
VDPPQTGKPTKGGVRPVPVTTPMEMTMKFFKPTKTFHDAEDGAVTVDWVVLTAAVVGLGVAALATIRKGTDSLTDKINNYLSSVTIDTN